MTLAIAPALAGPALAVPVSEPLSVGIGNNGVAIGYGYEGALGASGLMIEAMPTMLMVTSVAPGSPAALLDMPSPERYRVRLAALNGRAVEDLELRELQAMFNPARETVVVTLAKKGPHDLVESFEGPFELPLASAGIAALQSRWLAAQRRFTEAQDYLADRQRDADQLADNMMLAARDVAAGGDYAQALALVGRIKPGNPLYEEARKLKSRWRLSENNAQLSRADAYAGQGDFYQAIATLNGLTGDAAWLKIKSEREASWKDALAQREAYNAYKKAEAVKKANERAEARTALYNAQRREAIRRYNERQRFQEASRGGHRQRK
jgi:hypothetical protein